MRLDPRPRIQKIAADMLAKGQVPTVSAVRDVMGGGSPNIIAEELRKVRPTASALTQAAVQALPAAPSPGGTEIDVGEALRLVEQAASAAAALKEITPSVRDALESVPRLLASVDSQVKELLSLRAEVTAANEASVGARSWFANELDKIQARFEGVQKRMLLMVDDARRESAQLREQARLQNDGQMNREMILKQQLDDARREVARLNGLVEGLGGKPTAQSRGF